MNEFGGFILSYNGGEIINWETKRNDVRECTAQ